MSLEPRFERLREALSHPPLNTISTETQEGLTNSYVMYGYPVKSITCNNFTIDERSPTLNSKIPSKVLKENLTKS